MIVCRPRKRWPVYFTLSVYEIRNYFNGPNDDSRNERAAIMIAEVSEEFLKTLQVDNYD